MHSLAVNAQGEIFIDEYPVDGLGAAAKVVDSLVAGSTVKPVVFALAINSAVTIGYAKKVKGLIRRHYREIVVQRITGGQATYVRYPPLSDEAPDLSKMKPRNVFNLYVSSEMVEELNRNKRYDDLLRLKADVREFLVSDTTDHTLPELSRKDVPWFGKTLTASSSIVALRADSLIPYGTYQQVYDSITEVYFDLYDESALRQFGQPFAAVDPFQRNAIKTIYPFVLAELD